jgi:hypothetical protein
MQMSETSHPSATVLNILFLCLEFVSDFVLRISDFYRRLNPANRDFTQLLHDK